MNFITIYLENLEKRTGFGFLGHFAIVVLIAWVPAQLLWASIAEVFPGPQQPNYFESPLRAVTVVILLAPILETQMMRFNFWFLRKWTARKDILLGVSSAIWGIMHIYSEGWGIPAIWAFFVMGTIYLRFEIGSRDRAIVLTTLVHVTFNALSYGLYLFLNYLSLSAPTR